MYSSREVSFDEVSATSQKSFSSISSYGEVFKSPPSQKRNHQSFINNGSEYVERALELLSDHLNPGDSVLEIGTRNTDSLITLRGMVKRAGVVHGIALSELEGKQVLEQLKADGLQEGIHVHTGTTASRVVEPHSLDGIAITYMLELLDPDAAQSLLAECRSCLKATGQLAVVCATASSSRLLSSKRLKAPDTRQSLEAEGYSADVVKTISKSGWNVEIIVASVVDDIADEFREALEVNCNAPMETSLQMHCDTPQCPRTEEPSKPVPAPHASENSSKCMDPANWMSPGKENLKPPANVLKSPRQSLAFGLFGSSKKEPSKHQTSTHQADEVALLQGRLQEANAEVSALRVAFKEEQAKRVSLCDQLQALQAEPSCTRSQLHEWLHSCMTPNEIDAVAATHSDAADMPESVALRALLVAMVNNHQASLHERDAKIAELQNVTQAAKPSASARKDWQVQRIENQGGFMEVLKKLWEYLQQIPF